VSPHVDELLTDFLLGGLPRGEEIAVQQHLASCAKCAAELRALGTGFEALPASLVPIAPDPSTKERLLASIGAPEARTLRARFNAYLDRIAALLEVPLAHASAYLIEIEQPMAWEPGPVPGTEVFHLTPGPRLLSGVAGFVRLQPGVTFPGHVHRGEERAIILQGGLREDNGSESRAGEDARCPAESAHSITALPGEPCIFVVVVEEGIVLDPPYNL
jgi:anti-sigma factor ChrR (cupin superfamily)